MRKRLTAPPQTFLIDSRTLDASPVAAAAKDADVVIFALAVRARSGSGSIAVPEVARTLLAGIQKPAIAVSFGTPYLLREIPAAGTYICAYGVQPVMQVVAVHALFGEAPVSGKLPVTIPGLVARGTGIAKP
jgi:beta-N-acetylhexosaminidase